MKILVGIPALNTIPTKTVASLMGLQKPAGSQVVIIQNSLVYDARNTICQEAVNGGYDYLLFIDSDMIFPSDSFEQLRALDTDIATGVYFGRAGEHVPQVYSKLRRRTLFHDSSADYCKTIPPTVFDIAGCGMGLCLIKTSVIKALCKRYHNAPFEPFGGMGEDFCFCYRARKMGYKIKADGNLLLGHIGEKVYTKDDYERGMRVNA